MDSIVILNRKISKTTFLYLRLLHLRLLNTTTKSLIDNYFHQELSVLGEIKKTLNFDKTIYDKYYYRRKVIKNEITPNIARYLDLSMPNEFKLLVKYYTKFPSTKIKLLPIEFLESFEDHDKLIQIHPIVYVEHIKKNKNDSQYVSTLCAITSQNYDIFEKQKFYTIEIETDFYEPTILKLLKLRIKAIMEKTGINTEQEYIPENIQNQCMIFNDAFSLFVKKQNNDF
jgi:hypothetical protein